jgi:tetratricopeptide (TPR) repeat protein
MDLNAAVFRTATSADVNAESLHPMTVVDLMGKSDIRLATFSGTDWTDSPIAICETAHTSNAHIRSLTQIADNFLNYYDLERASDNLKKAESAVGCLQELFNPDDIRQMYYIRGILEYHKGNKDASIQAFSSAIRIKPDLQWNNIYSPDAKPNFDAAKENFIQLQSIPMEIYPQEALSSLWINGAPLLDKEDPQILVGRNIIQIVGLETKTYEITVPDNIEQIRIVAPSTTPVSAIDWIGAEREAELSLIAESLLPMESTIYAHDSGQVWQNTIGTPEWNALKVSKFTEARLNSKQIIGQSLLWSGGSASLISLGFGLYHYNKGYTAYRTMQTTNDWAEYEATKPTLEGSRAPLRTSVVSLGAGLLLTGIGYSITF